VSNITNDPHVYAEAEFIIQHNVVARPACCWTTTQLANRLSDFWPLTSFETWVTLKIKV
jgi:hypothetical protein